MPNSQEEDNHPETTRIVDYSSERSSQSDTSSPDLGQSQSQLQSQPGDAQSDHMLPQRSPSPDLGAPQQPDSPTSSPSLGDRLSSPSLGGSPQRTFGSMNRGGGSSPGPLSSGVPTRDHATGSQPIGMDIEPDEAAAGGSIDSGGTAPTQIATPLLEYASATPFHSDASHEETPPGPVEQDTSGENGDGEGTQPTQIVSPEVDMQDAVQEQAGPSVLSPITPYRVGEPSRFQRGSTLPSPTDPHLSPTRALTTPIGLPNSNPYKLDRSTKSAFSPPKRARPDAQLPIPQLDVGLVPSPFSPTRWDAARAEEEERAARLSGRQASVSNSMPLPRTPSPRRRPATATGVGMRDVLSSSTPFVSGRGADVSRETPRLVRSPLSPRKAAMNDPEDEDGYTTEPGNVDDSPSKQGPGVVRRESSLPLEMGRQARLQAREEVREEAATDHPQSETENESEEEATPQRRPGRGGVSTARRGRGVGRGRGGGRGRSAATTPKTPHENRSGPPSPAKTSTGKKRPRTAGLRETSPAPAKKAKVQLASTAHATPFTLSGTRVLAWWTGGDYYFGTITGCESSSRYKIRFDDETETNVLASKVRQASLRVGDHVQVALRDKQTSYKADAVVTGIAHWETKHKVRVAMGSGGKGSRMEADSRDISVPTREVGKYWGDRTLNEDTPVSSSASTKRKAAIAIDTGVSSRGGTRLAGYAFVITVKAEDIGVQDTQLEEWKAKLRARIDGHGGIVVDEWEDLFTVRGKGEYGGWYSEVTAVQYVGGSRWPNLRKVFLLSGKMGTTPKYMMALALGVPCLSYKWVEEYLQDVRPTRTSISFVG